VAQVRHGIGDEVRAYEVDSPPGKAHKQRLKRVDPGEGAFAAKARL
jgi:hypothetical protein